MLIFTLCNRVRKYFIGSGVSRLFCRGLYLHFIPLPHLPPSLPSFTSLHLLLFIIMKTKPQKDNLSPASKCIFLFSGVPSLLEFSVLFALVGGSACLARLDLNSDAGMVLGSMLAIKKNHNLSAIWYF